MGKLADEVNAKLAEAKSAEEGLITRYAISDEDRRNINDLRTKLKPRVPLFERMGFDQISDVQNFNAEIQGTKVGRIFFGLEDEKVFQSPNYNRLLRTLGDQFQPNPKNGSIIDQLNADLNANPSLEPRLRRAIKDHPNEIAGILPSYNAANGSAGTRILTQALDQYAPVARTRAAPEREAPTSRGGNRPAPSGVDYAARLETEVTAFGEKGAEFVTVDERAHIARLSRTARANGEVTRDEYNIVHKEMDRLDERGAQDLPPPPSRSRTAPHAPAAGAPAQQQQPAAPPRYSPPDQLKTPEDYGRLMGNLGKTMKVLMPEGMDKGIDADGFLKKLEDPQFRNQFIQKYNSDPQYRQAIQLLYHDADRLAEMKGKGGNRELDPNSEIGRRSGLLQGQFRTLINNPDDLLNFNKVFELQQGVSGLANFAGGISGMLDQMPPWLRGLLAPVLDLFQNVLGPLFTKEGFQEMGKMAKDAMGSLSLAGNGGGDMLGGLMNGTGLANLFGGGTNTGAGTGAPAPTTPPPQTRLATADPAPVIGGTSPT